MFAFGFLLAVILSCANLALLRELEKLVNFE
jgi:hypothetical protein